MSRAARHFDLPGTVFRNVPNGTGCVRAALSMVAGLATVLVSHWCLADDPPLIPTTPAHVPFVGPDDDEPATFATSLAMGGASTVALAAHGAFLELASRRRARLERRCGDLCPEYRVDEYEEARRMASLSLSAGVLAAASSVWLMYNDPDQLLRVSHPGKRVRKAGLTLKLRPKKRGLWATMVARF